MKKEISLFIAKFCTWLIIVESIEEDSTGITVEIDLLVHHKLLEDLTNNIFTKKISTRKIELFAYIVGNPFLTIKIYNDF